MQRRRRVARAAMVVFALSASLTAVGYELYRRHAAKQELAAEVAAHLATARKALAAADDHRWTRATAAARAALDLEPANADAIGIAAEALLASALGDGVNAPGKTLQARKLIGQAVEEGITGPAIERAHGLNLIVSNQPDRAIAKLQPLLAAAPGDGALALYLAWAHTARHDTAAALAAFDQAAASDAVRRHALYGRGRVKLSQVDLDGARADFAAVLELAKDHIGAQVGLAAALPAAQAQQQESDVLAILSRPDLDKADPRAVVQAWALAADAAARGGRYDEARERYRKALALAADDLGALTGLAELEVVEGKLDAAHELVTKVLAARADSVRAQLVAAEIAVRAQRFDDASARIDALGARALPAAEQSRIRMLAGRLAEARGEGEAAVDAYLEAAKLAGATELAPTLAAVAQLAKLADAAAAAKDTARAAAHRERAAQLLATLEGDAERDPKVALTLGMAYVQGGDPAKGEAWLRKVVAARPGDPDGHYQLARALVRLGRAAEAVDRLQQARTLAPDRLELGIELARTYEALGRDRDAIELYGQLLAAKDANVELRARAGRFFVRVGQLDKAGALGKELLDADPGHAMGYFLRGEGLLAADQPDEAFKAFSRAVDLDATDPLFHDGLGRAAEARTRATGDTRYLDTALRAYQAALQLDATIFTSQLGLGRVQLARREYEKAPLTLQAAYNLRRDHHEAPYLIGLAYKDVADKREAAAEWFQKSYSNKPTADAAWHLGMVYVELNRGKAAIGPLTNAVAAARAAEKKGEPEPAWFTEALYQLGSLHNAEGNLAPARAAWEEYVGRNPPPGARLDEVKRLLSTSLRGR